MYGHLMGTSWAPVAALAFGEISLLLKFYFKYVQCQLTKMGEVTGGAGCPASRTAIDVALASEIT
jgi:hypothetical protein